ncbi:MAG: hypothetical protein MSC31_17600 [Solirubrobacteraceae bacterium MAG38_C4-C5]|nr:hypothetical protein [Candidatus Siliceabacter maunaloa]
MLPARIYLFDDNELERNGREVLLHRMRAELVGEMVADGVPNIVNPEVRATSSRREFFEWLDADEEPSLVVIDLSSDIKELNFVGARILRAVAEDNRLAQRCWRVALSKYATVEIADELQGLAHSIVRDTNVDTQRLLTEAVRAATGNPLGSTVAITQHPATQDRVDWDETLRALVEELVGVEAMRGDEFIVQSLIKGVPSNVIDDELEREREESRGQATSRRNVNEFLKRVMATTGEPTVTVAHERVAQLKARLRGKTIHEPLTPEAVERAHIALDRVVRFDKEPARRHRLTEDDLLTADDLISRFPAEVEQVALERQQRARRNSGIIRHSALRRVLAQPPFNANSEVAQYAVWTLSDVIRTEPQIDSVP